MVSRNCYAQILTSRMWLLVISGVFILAACAGGGAQPPSTKSFTVGGNVLDLTGSGLVLQNNGANDLNISTNGDFSFTVALANGASYSVRITSQPSGQICSIDGRSSGTVSSANITDIQINCITLPQLWLSANDGVTGFEFFRSDGTAANTTLIKDINLSGNSNPGNLANFSQGKMGVINGVRYFVANDGVTGFELWKSDGTATGTMQVKDINTGPSGSNPSSFVVMNNILYFIATDTANGKELWKSNGTENGTELVKDIIPGPISSNPSSLTVMGNSLYFVAYDPTVGIELWKSNGTRDGTIILKDIFEGTNATGGFPNSSGPGSFTVMGGTLYFQAFDPINGRELWKSDGTRDGTILLKDIFEGIDTRTGDANSGYPGLLTTLGDIFYFTANNVAPSGSLNVANGTQLWKSNGTPEGTVMLKEIIPGAGGQYPGQLTVVGSLLYFTAGDATTGVELWKSNGTVEGTVMVDNINPLAGHSDPSSLTAVGNTLYFAANDGINGVELWKSDGTVDGTMMVKNISRLASSSPGFLTAVDDTLYFLANDGTTGVELWKSNGTEEGTVNVVDLIPNSTSGMSAILRQ